MRLKFNGLSDGEKAKLKMGVTIPLNQAVTLLNHNTLTRFEQELVVLSLKDNLCQYVYAQGQGRLFLNMGIVHNMKSILDQATQKLGFCVYREYVQEAEEYQARMIHRMQNRMVFNTHQGTQIPQEQLSY